MPSPCTLKSPPAAHRLPPIASPPPTVRHRQRISANGVNATPSGVSICRCFLCSPNCADLISSAARSPHPNEGSPPHPLPGPIAPPCATAAAAVTLSTAAGPRRSSGVPQPWGTFTSSFCRHASRSALRNIHGARTALPPGVAGATLQRVPARPPSTHTRHTNVLLPSTPTPTPTPHRRSFSIAAAPSSTLLHPPPLPLPAQLYFIRLGLN